MGDYFDNQFERSFYFIQNFFSECGSDVYYVMAARSEGVGLLTLDPLVLEKILSFLNPFEIAQLELINHSLRTMITPLWSYLLSTLSCIKYLTYKKSFTTSSYNFSSSNSIINSSPTPRTPKESALIAWRAHHHNTGVCVQIGGLCPFPHTQNLFAFRDLSRDLAILNSSSSTLNLHTTLRYEECSEIIFHEDRLPLHFQPIVAPAITVDSFGRPVTFGGWLAEDEVSTSDCYYFSPSTGWARFHSLFEPLCFASASRLITGEILLCGGSDTLWRGSVVSTQVELFLPVNLGSLSLPPPTPLAPLLTPRCGHSTVTHYNSHTYAIGGYGGGREYHSSGEYFSVELNQWFPIAPMHERRSGPGLGMGVDGSLYCVGGSSDGSDSSDTIERYDPRCGEWSVLSSRMNERRGYVSACFNAQGTIFYVAGGITGDQLIPSIEWYDIRMNRRWEYLVNDAMGEVSVGYQRGDYNMMFVLPELIPR
jgi:hypothetical protein